MPVIRHLDLQADEHFRHLQKRAAKQIQDAKDEWPDEWHRFCEIVHTYRRQQSCISKSSNHFT